MRPLICLMTLVFASPSAAMAQPPAGDYLPVGPGAHWSYTRIRHEDGSRTPIEKHYLGVVPAKRWKVAEFRVITGRRAGYEYLTQQRDGLYRHENSLLGGMSGVSPRRRLILKLPFEQGTEWRFDEVHMPQTSGNAAPLDPEDYRTYYVSRVEAVGEIVEVPAGRHSCVRVNLMAENRRWGQTSTVSWYAKGVGLVKRDSRDAQGNTVLTWELEKFTPPKTSVDVASDLRKVLGTKGELLEGSSFAVGHGSRFYLAEGESGPILARVFEGEVTSFDPTSIASWNAFFRDENWKRTSDGFGSDGRFARLCALLFVRQSGADVGKLPYSKMTSGPRGERETFEYQLHGSGWIAGVDAAFAADTLVELELGLRPRD